MSVRTTARHADWLALVEPSGPFLTLPVLRRGFPAGLDRTPPALRAEFRERRPGPDLRLSRHYACLLNEALLRSSFLTSERSRGLPRSAARRAEWAAAVGTRRLIG